MTEFRKKNKKNRNKLKRKYKSQNYHSQQFLKQNPMTYQKTDKTQAQSYKKYYKKMHRNN